MSKILLAREGFSLLKSLWPVFDSRALRAFCQRCSSESVNLRKMRCESLRSIVLYNVYHFIAYVKNIIIFFCPFLENNYFGFLGVDFKHPGVAI